MSKFSFKLFILAFLSTNAVAQPVFFQAPSSNPTVTQSKPGTLPPPTILSPTEFKNRVNTLDQQNQQNRAQRLQQLSGSLPGPLAPPKTTTQENATNAVNTAAPIQPAQPQAAAPPPPATVTTTPPESPGAEPYTPSFQGGGSQPAQAPASGGGNWNIKY